MKINIEKNQNLNKIYNLLKLYNKYVILFLVMSLISFLFFQLGFIFGAKFYQPCEIKIFKNGNY